MTKIVDIELSNFLNQKEISNLFKDNDFLKEILFALSERKNINCFEKQTFSQFISNFNVIIESI